MQMFLLCLFALAIGVSSENVEVLGTNNFEDFVTSNEFVLAEFYAPWCGHCQRLEPEYEKAATTLKEAGSSVRLAKIDCTVHADLATKFAVKGYPTLKWFRNGNPSEYNGPRTHQEIVAWINKKSSPPSKHLASLDDVTSYLKQAGTKILAYFDESQVDGWQKHGSDEKLESFSFAHVTDSSLFGDKKTGTVELHRDGESPLVFDQSGTVPEWILREGFPLVDELAQESWTRAMNAKSDILAVFLKAPSGPEYDALTTVAKANRGKFAATYTTNADIGARWGTSGKVLPTAVYIEYSGGKPAFTIWDEAKETTFDATTLGAFVDSARKGEYQSFVKSEPIPESNDGPVTVVVGKNFDAVVNSKKDVFIEFYAPWCGHCQKLAPVFDELGSIFKDDPNVVIAKMDATANSVPKDYDIRGYPTLILVDSNNNKKPFDGSDRELEDLKQFIETNRASKSLKEEM